MMKEENINSTSKYDLVDILKDKIYDTSNVHL
jgi:hypothetical protein